MAFRARNRRPFRSSAAGQCSTMCVAGPRSSLQAGQWHRGRFAAHCHVEASCLARFGAPWGGDWRRHFTSPPLVVAADTTRHPRAGHPAHPAGSSRSTPAAISSTAAFFSNGGDTDTAGQDVHRAHAFPAVDTSVATGRSSAYHTRGPAPGGSADTCRYDCPRGCRWQQG